MRAHEAAAAAPPPPPSPPPCCARHCFCGVCSSSSGPAAAAVAAHGGATAVVARFLFEGAGFTYDQGASSNTTYLLYSNSKTAWLEPASTCGGNSGSGCNLYLTNPNQVQLDFLSTKVAQGPTGGIPNASNGFENLSTLVFTATKEGTTGFSFLFNPVFGGALGLADGQQPNLELGEGFSVVVPEPGLALMSMAALGTIALVRRNRR